MKLPTSPFHLLYDGEPFHVVKEGGELPSQLVDTWNSAVPMPNAIRIYSPWGRRMPAGWYVGMVNMIGGEKALRRVRCMARAKTWIRQRFLATPELRRAPRP